MDYFEVSQIFVDFFTNGFYLNNASIIPCWSFDQELPHVKKPIMPFLSGFILAILFGLYFFSHEVGCETWINVQTNYESLYFRDTFAQMPIYKTAESDLLPDGTDRIYQRYICC